MNILLYIIIALVVMIVSSVFEMYLNGCVLFSVILGLIWPFSLIAVALAFGIFIAVSILAFISMCLELLAIKISKILNISLNSENTESNELI